MGFRKGGCFGFRWGLRFRVWGLRFTFFVVLALSVLLCGLRCVSGCFCLRLRDLAVVAEVPGIAALGLRACMGNRL